MKKYIILIALLILLTTINFQQPAYAMGESSYIAAGWGTTFYITKDGNLWGYGKNDQGLLGIGVADYVEEPIKLLSDVKTVTANRYAVFAIKKDGTLWYWGRPAGMKKTLEPTKFMDDVVMISMDEYYNGPVLFCTGEGKLYYLLDETPELITHSEKVKFVVTNGSENFFINEKDELWGWCVNKNGTNGSLGVGYTGPVLNPVKILEDVQYVACDNTNSMIIRKDKSLWMCGSGHDGKFYDGSKEIDAPVLTPLKIMDNVIHAAAQNNHFFVVKSDNTLWAWGNNDNKSLGGGHLSSPIKWATGVNSITVGYQHKVVAKTDNTLWTGGRKDGVYHATENFQNELRQTATGLIDSPATWALAEVREAEYRKLVPPSMQSDYSKIVSRSEFCTLAITCIEQINEMTIEDFMKVKNIDIPSNTSFVDIGILPERAKKDIMAAQVLNIVAGTSSTTFDPNNPITREQAAKMLTATAKVLGDNVDSIVPNFADQDMISEWAKPYIGYVFSEKIMSGVGQNRFDPRGGYQRQQAYMTLLRLYKNIRGIEF